ncbi:MAG TPA: hypothetical protein DCS67_12445 [Clostridiales bacterium UBA8960]|jgi:DNA-binding transcriptional MerR regulator|nr:hypothetical protein [Clostridiales bacterium UBA8960]
MKEFDQIMTFLNPTSQEIPNINLYMDQLLEFYERTLGPLKRSGEDTVFTKTMINNYVKSNLVSPPLKKKYAKSAIEDLIIIYHLKKSFSIQDISHILAALKTNGSYYDQFIIDYDTIREDTLSALNPLLETLDATALLQQLIVEISFKKQLADALIDQLKTNP